MKARLAFMRAALHMQGHRMEISCAQVKMVEAPDYCWDWPKYFFGKFHEELRSAKSMVDSGTAGKLYLSSHIQIIFAAKEDELVDETLERVIMRRRASYSDRTNPGSTPSSNLPAIPQTTPSANPVKFWVLITTLNLSSAKYE
ncbi:unnamed protein product [Calypogeia fissa]